MTDPIGPTSRGRLAALGLAIALAGVAGCGEEPPPAPEVARPVKMMQVGGPAARETREYPGVVKAFQTAEMAFEVPGKIVEFRYKEGAEVPEGAVIARLDPRDYEAQVDSAQAQYDNAKNNYDRAQKLFEEGALAAIERDRRQTALDTADAALREATKALEDTELRAPFSGVLARKLVEDYANVQAKQVVLVLTDDESLEIKLAVPERDLSGQVSQHRSPEQITRRIQPEVLITSMPDRRFPARLTELANTADPETRTFEATFAFDNPPDASILPGMTAKVIIQVPEDRSPSRGILIPATAAVADDEGNAFVWVVDTDTMTVSPRPVQLGPLTGDDVVVREGLEGGETIATSGVQQLRDGMAVRRFDQ
jgi:multidrug efflux system membrane fusion protein